MESVELLRLLDELKRLSEEVKLVRQPSACTHGDRSPELKNIFGALAKAQAEMQVAGLTNENPYFKSRYADLAEVVRASRPSLTKNGLAVVQQILPNDDGQSILHTILCHMSGEWIETRMRIIPPKNDIQTLGSYITYLRRYSYAALVGIVASDEDDDGEVAMADARQIIAKGAALNKYSPKDQSYDTITKEQLEELEYELAACPDLAEEIMDKMHIQSLADLPKSKYHQSVTRIREIKLMRNQK